MNCNISDRELQRIFGELGFVTGSEANLPLMRQAIKAACLSDITVLLDGETGTGKQVLAHAIHQLDQKRRLHPFITVHCGTINEALAESELFGHEQGAFSGAVRPRDGLFRAARGGTVLLDDVNDLPLSMQAKLLDVLQRRVVRAVGSDRELPIDVRVMAASNMQLDQLVRQNSFRADLYYRLTVVHLSLPPLRERIEDLPALVLAFAHRHQEVFPGITSVEPELTAYLSASCLSFTNWTQSAAINTSSASPPTLPATGKQPVAIAVADFNGDGKLDLAVVNQADKNVSIFLGKGNGTFTAGATPATGNQPTALAVGDFNADGIPDLAVVNQADKNVSIFLGKRNAGL